MPGSESHRKKRRQNRHGGVSDPYTIDAVRASPHPTRAQSDHSQPPAVTGLPWPGTVASHAPEQWPHMSGISSVRVLLSGASMAAWNQAICALLIWCWRSLVIIWAHAMRRHR